MLYASGMRRRHGLFPILALGLWPRFLDATIHEAMIALRILHYNPIWKLSEAES